MGLIMYYENKPNSKIFYNEITFLDLSNELEKTH